LKKDKDKKLKILMIAPTPFFADRGCHVKILEELKSLSKRDIKIILATYHIGRDIGGFDIRRIMNIPWYKKLDAGPSIHKYYLDIILAIKSLFIAIRFRPDILHAHMHEGVFVAKIVRLFIRRPIVADYQGSMVAEMLDHGFMEKKSLSFKFNLWLEKTINRWPDKIIFSSTPAKDFFLKTFDIAPGKVVSFVEGTNTDDFHPDYDTGDLVKKYGIPGDKTIVIYAGVLTKYQGIDILIKSVPGILRRCPDTHFVIVGFPDVEKYRKLAEKNKVLSNITFTGKVPHEEIPRYLCLGDVGVSLKLSRTEANGKLFGYMAVGLACVVFDTKTNKEILGNTGLYAIYDDKDSFIDTISGLIKDRKKIASLGDQARKRVLRDYSWDKTFSNFIPIYKNLGSR